jgi:hypothetical protein
MASSEHDAMIAAFKRIDPGVVCCDCAGPKGYTHLHGPNHPPSKGSCHNHFAVVEKQNGTIAPQKDLASFAGAQLRPSLPISEHPLGYAAGPEFGNFNKALDYQTVLSRWGNLDDFAKALTMLAEHRAIGRW